MAQTSFTASRKSPAASASHTSLDHPSDSDAAPCESPLSSVFRGMDVAIARDTDTLYEQAFAEHWRDVFQFILAWTNDWAAAEDLSQEAFLRLWRSRAKIDWREPILPWLIVAGRRLANDRFRQIRRRVGVLPPPAALDESLHIRWLDIQSALKDLSPLERSAVVLVTFQGISTAEVARVLNTSPGGVRAALSRGRDKLGDAG